MIVKMSKVEVVGPRDRLIAVLDTIRDTHTLQIDPDIQQRMREGVGAPRLRGSGGPHRSPAHFRLKKIKERRDRRGGRA